MSEAPITLSITSLSQFVSLQNCERYLRFRIHPQEAKRFLDRWRLTIQPLTPLLEESGTAFESDVEGKLAETGEAVIDLRNADVMETARWIKDVSAPVNLLQAPVSAQLGGTICKGQADIVRLERDKGGVLHAHVADIKASRKSRMQHQLQVAAYAMVLREMAHEAGAAELELAGSVLHLQEDGSLPTLDAKNPDVDLDTYFTVLERMLTAPDNLVDRIAELPFSEVAYHLTYRCDGCMFNSVCMYDSAERLDLSLIQGLTAAEKRAFRASGVDNLLQLSPLMDLPNRGSGAHKLNVAAGQAELFQRLNSQWAIAPKLPFLVQKAKASLRNFDRSTESAPFIFDSGFGSLPSQEEYPELVKIFFDAQKDYLKDRLYLISGLVKGPLGEQVFVRGTEGPPSAADEQRLLEAWIGETLLAMQAVSSSEVAPIHLYCYDRFDQRILLEALKRHLDAVASIPGFFDLMTQSPALEQPIISFLADELRDRKNMGLTCMPLHDAARLRGFDWQDGESEFYRLFRARLFDNRRNVTRLTDGRIEPAGPDLDSADPSLQRIESASRFNSQIPLEYAYAVWGKLPDVKEHRRILEPFRQVNQASLQAFAAHRVRALAFLEVDFSPKTRFMDKPSIAISAIASDGGRDLSLARSLKDFLFIEHHTALQAKEITYSLPIEQRIQTGLAMLLRLEAENSSVSLYRFGLEYESLGLDPTLLMNACRLKEDSWVVLNETNPIPPTGRIKHGRIGIVKEVGDDWVDLELLKITFRNGRFRYYHRSDLAPELGELYTIDEMADDINADKILAALDHAPSNTLYNHLVRFPASDAAPSDRSKFFSGFCDLIGQSMREGQPTKAQRRVICDHLGDSVFLVQGPPGTGKSITLAWVVVAKLAINAKRSEPFRVAICCKTHTATNVILEAVAKTLRQLSGFAMPQFGLDKLRQTPVYKVVNDLGDAVPEGVTPIRPYGSARADLRRKLSEPFLMIGGTPGGIYNLRRYEAGKVADLDWAEKTFDLLVVDEASQMSVPEGILAAAFLKPKGQVIVVGDHRQMPPIVAHDWEEEERRSITENHPYLSLFEYLKEQGFPIEGLDESFRLHKVIADFLRENIYIHDGIPFYSKRVQLLTQAPPTSAYVDSVLQPEFPIVVIEHSESGSQQYNQLELDLAKPLIETCATKLKLNGWEGIGVVVPHRAQRALLQKAFPKLADAGSIDTVERFQGGERDVIIVSATASDPDYVLAEASFLLNLNRLNVALSRPRMKLIVIASRSVVDLLTSDLDVFENAVIWKRLYHKYSPELLHTERVNGVNVWVRGRPGGSIPPAHD